MRFICPGSCQCGNLISVPDRYAGQRVRCPVSAERILVPPGPMTEAVWFSSPSPQDMLRRLPDAAGDRQLRLFAVACCRRIWDVLPEGWARQGVLVVERYADGQASDRELSEVSTALGAELMARYRAYQEAAAGSGNRGELYHAHGLHALGAAQSTAARRWPDRAATDAAAAAAPPGDRDAYAAESAAQADLLRDIVGNPFRPAVVAVDWLTWNDGCIVALARSIYEERRFAELLVLADALEEAGCTDVAILGHCRGAGPHVRGCWALDLILGKG
jgi:hypothetical protein